MGRHRSWGWLGSRSGSWWKELKWVEIALVIRGGSHAEVDVRLRDLWIAGRSDCSDDLPVGDNGSSADDRGAEMRERHGIPVAGHHRDDETTPWHGADKAHHSRSSGMHLLAT